MAQFSFGLAGGAVAAIIGGLLLKRWGLYDFGTLLEIVGAVAAVVTIVGWLRSGETTACPECRRLLTADPETAATRHVTFICQDCQIQWETGPEPEA